MDKKTNRTVAYAMAGVFLLAGIIGYVAFPYEAPAEPVRIMFSASAGSVTFDHMMHAQDYGLDCEACHHHYVGVQEDFTGGYLGCRECHVAHGDWDEPPQVCVDCHTDQMIEDYLEGAEYPGPFDTFHDDYSLKSCVGCHEDMGGGPGKGPENCSRCHVL